MTVRTHCLTGKSARPGRWFHVDLHRQQVLGFRYIIIVYTKSIVD